MCRVHYEGVWSSGAMVALSLGRMQGVSTPGTDSLVALCSWPWSLGICLFTLELIFFMKID